MINPLLTKTHKDCYIIHIFFQFLITILYLVIVSRAEKLTSATLFYVLAEIKDK